MNLQTIRRAILYARAGYHWKIAGSERLPYMPDDISIEVTNSCNFQCSFCPQSSPTHHQASPRAMLTPEGADILLGKLRTGGVRTGTIHWTLDGEPFVNMQFHNICGVAHRLGFMTSILSTNGSLASSARLAELPRPVGARYVLAVDFCADRESFEEVRGTAGSWVRILTNIREALTSQQLTHIAVCITDISNYRISDPLELSSRFRKLKDLFAGLPRVRFRTRVFHNVAGLVEIGAPQSSSQVYYSCPYPWTSMVIASNGDVVACCRDLEHQTVLGNLFEQELEEIWNGDRARAVRRALTARTPERIRACQGCDMPWNASKFTAANVLNTIRHRMRLF